MIDHARDLAEVFFGEEFAIRFVRLRSATEDIEVRAILGSVDDDALEGRVVAAARTVHFAAGQDVRVGDQLRALEDGGPDVPIGTTFKLLDTPRRVNDGNEMRALLGSVGG